MNPWDQKGDISDIYNSSGEALMNVTPHYACDVQNCDTPKTHLIRVELPASSHQYAVSHAKRTSLTSIFLVLKVRIIETTCGRYKI